MPSQYLLPFLSASLAFDSMELKLPAPQRGHTWTLKWRVTDGAFVPQGTTLWEQISDAGNGEHGSFRAPLPARVSIFQPDGSYCHPGVIGQLRYGEALEVDLRKEWQDLAIDLATALTRHEQAETRAPLSPRDLMAVVVLERALTSALRRAGLARPPAAVSAAAREEHGIAALHALTTWKIDTVAASDIPLPPEVAERLRQLWQHLGTHVIGQLRSRGLPDAIDFGMDED